VIKLKNIILSILVITMTIICVSFMLSEGDTETLNEIKVNQIYNSRNKTKNENTPKAEKKKEGVQTEAVNAVERKNIDSIGTKNSGLAAKKIKQSSSEEMIIFKVPKQDLLTSISKEDKIKILSIMDKISPSDYARINNYLKSQVGNSEMINIIRILKTRLSYDDYYELREIAARYIYIEKLEKIIKA
jgi:hypothetical protein